MNLLETRLARLESLVQLPDQEVTRFIAEDGAPWLRRVVAGLAIEMPDDGISTCPIAVIIKAIAAGLDMPTNLSPDTRKFWDIAIHVRAKF